MAEAAEEVPVDKKESVRDRIAARLEAMKALRVKL
jgi:hypothetical protein